MSDKKENVFVVGRERGQGGHGDLVMPMLLLLLLLLLLSLLFVVGPLAKVAEVVV